MRVFFAFLALIMAPNVIFADKTAIQVVPDYVPEVIIKKALEYLKTPYVYAGTTRKGVDCSGLVWAVWSETVGQSLPRGVGVLYATGEKVTGSYMPADLVFFDTVGGPSHVGIFIGGTEFIHAASAGPETGVIVSSLTEDYYSKRLLGARRIVAATAPLVRMKVGDPPDSYQMASVLPKGTEVTFAMKSWSSDAKTFTFRIMQKDKVFFETPVTVSLSVAETYRFAVPETGKWSLVVTDEKAVVRGEVLFTVADGFQR